MNDVETLLLKVRKIANKEFDGHFCIFKFSTGYKSIFGTLDLDTGRGRDYLWFHVPGFITLHESLANLLRTEINNHWLSETFGHLPKNKKHTNKRK